METLKSHQNDPPQGAQPLLFIIKTPLVNYPQYPLLISSTNLTQIPITIMIGMVLEGY